MPLSVERIGEKSGSEMMQPQREREKLLPLQHFPSSGWNNYDLQMSQVFPG